MLDTFLKTDKISPYFEPIGKYNENICSMYTTRIRVNTECCDRFVQNKKKETIDLKYDGKTEKYKVCVGTPITATQNIKDKQMFSTMEFIVQDIKHNNVKINGEWFDISKSAEYFIPSLSVTVYNTKAQTSMRTIISAMSIARVKDNSIPRYLVPESLSSFI